MKFTEQSQTKTKEKSQVAEAVGVSSKVKEKAKVDSKLMYRNEMNSITFPKFTAMDFNIFFIILYYVSKCIKKNGGIIEMIRKSDNETDEFIEVKFGVLRMFLPQVKNKKRFFNEIVKFVLYKLKYVSSDRISYNDLKKLNNGISGKVAGAPFFKDCEVNADEELLKVKLSSFAYSVLGEFGNFMSFDINEFCSFENKYTKTLFRLLKQYENLDSKQIFMNKVEFLNFMNIKGKYQDNISIIERETIIPSIKELNNKSISFENVDYEKIYYENEKIKDIIKRRNVKGFKFIFEKRKN